MPTPAMSESSLALRVSFYWARLCLVTAVPLAIGACPAPDPAGKYKAFQERTEDEREDALNVKMDMGGALIDVSGQFLFALAVNLKPETPLQFYTTVTFTPEGVGGVLDLDLQPLALAVGSTTEPRTFVGDPIVAHGNLVDMGGKFQVDLSDPTVNVVGEANPLTGSPIEGALLLQGFIQDADLFCGTVTGMVLQPIQSDLAGSTFAAVRVESPTDLPTEVLGACPAAGGGTGGSGEGTGDSGEGGGSGGSTSGG